MIRLLIKKTELYNNCAISALTTHIPTLIIKATLQKFHVKPTLQDADSLQHFILWHFYYTSS